MTTSTPMQILEPHDQSGWITAIIEGRWVQAKVYDEPSSYGIDGGRVSKIAICKTANRDPKLPFHDQLSFHYDRGLDFNHEKKTLVKKIVAQLEALPKVLS